MVKIRDILLVKVVTVIQLFGCTVDQSANSRSAKDIQHQTDDAGRETTDNEKGRNSSDANTNTNGEDGGISTIAKTDESIPLHLRSGFQHGIVGEVIVLAEGEQSNATAICNDNPPGSLLIIAHNASSHSLIVCSKNLYKTPLLYGGQFETKVNVGVFSYDTDDKRELVIFAISESTGYPSKYYGSYCASAKGLVSGNFWGASYVSGNDVKMSDIKNLCGNRGQISLKKSLAGWAADIILPNGDQKAVEVSLIPK